MRLPMANNAAGQVGLARPAHAVEGEQTGACALGSVFYRRIAVDECAHGRGDESVLGAGDERRQHHPGCKTERVASR